MKLLILLTILIYSSNSMILLNSEANNSFQKGYEYFSNSEYQKAIKQFTKTIEIEKDAYEAYFLRAVCYGFINEHTKAINDYDVIENVKYMKRHIILNNRGLEYVKLNQNKNAIKDFSKAIEILPSFAEPYNNRGHQLEELGDFQNALLDYYSAIELDESSDKQIYLYNAARLESIFGNENYAMLLLDKALSINPDFKEAIELKDKFKNKFANLMKN